MDIFPELSISNWKLVLSIEVFVRSKPFSDTNTRQKNEEEEEEELIELLLRAFTLTEFSFRSFFYFSVELFSELDQSFNKQTNSFRCRFGHFKTRLVNEIKIDFKQGLRERERERERLRVESSNVYFETDPNPGTRVSDRTRKVNLERFKSI